MGEVTIESKIAPWKGVLIPSGWVTGWVATDKDPALWAQMVTSTELSNELMYPSQGWSSIVNTKVCDSSFLHFFAPQETKTCYSVVEGNVDDWITKLNGARNERDGIEQRSVPNRESTSVDPDNDRELSIGRKSSRAEHVEAETNNLPVNRLC